MSYFTTADYMVFALALAFSAAIGIFHALRPACKKRKVDRRKSITHADSMLTGGRKLPIIPTAISLLCSFVSGIALLFYPEEVYTKGTALAWSLLGAILAIVFTGIFIIPVMHPLKYVNLYQYLEDRFDSKILKYYGDFLFALSSIVYSAVVLYVPCKALTQVTILPMWAFLLIVGLVCTIYTAIGGIKAVIWTDTFQGVIMYAGIITLLVKGVLAVGETGKSISDLVKEGRTARRLDGLTNIDYDPFQYMTVWTAIFGGMAYWLSVFGANQIALQRFCNLPSLNGARLAALLNIPGMSVVFVLVFATGLVMYAYNSAYCHPEGVGKDGLVMHFMLQVLKQTYGFPGLFMAAVMSGTLSSVSSAINALAAVTMTDFLEPLAPNLGPKTAHFGIVTISFVYGIFIVGVAFFVEPMGGAMRVLFHLLDVLTGPSAGLLLLGILVPWADDVGGFLGTAFGCAVNLAILLTKVVYKPHGHQNLPNPKSCCFGKQTVCEFEDFSTIAIENITISAKPSENWLEHISSLSGLTVPLIGLISTLFIGMTISSCSRRSNSEGKPELVFWSRNKKRVSHMQPLDL